MKGMSQTLYIVVAAIVILVVALVVITVFGGGIGRFASAVEARNYCLTTYTPVCALSGSFGDGWNNIRLDVNGIPRTCSDLAGDCSCEPDSKKVSCMQP